MIKPLLHLPRHGFSSEVDLSNLKALLETKHAVLWLDIQDPMPEELALLEREFGFHELALEDVAHPHERPKLEEYEQHYFLVFYSVGLTEEDEPILAELDLFVGANYVVAVHRQPIPEIEEAANRWQHNQALLEHGVGALVHALLDSVVDGYFRVADRVAERVGELEEAIFRGADQQTLQEVFILKKRLLGLRRLLGPERDVLNVLLRRDLPFLDSRTVVYLRDVYDHLARITDVVDLQSDLLTSVMDVYLSSVSNRLNQIVKTLTSVTIILMTVTLVASIYGMNFRNVPEFEWSYGYPWALSLMAILSVGLYILLRRRDWL